MEYKDKNLKIIKQQDGSLIEKIGIKETVYKKPFIPFSFEIEEITYSKNIYYNPYGEEIFPVTDEERGLDSYFDPVERNQKISEFISGIKKSINWAICRMIVTKYS